VTGGPRYWAMGQNDAARDREPPDSPPLRFGPEDLGAEVARLTAELEAQLERLGRSREHSRPSEGTRELGENRQIGVQPHPLQSTHAERQ
jgi:hypothetical protein